MRLAADLRACVGPGMWLREQLIEGFIWASVPPARALCGWSCNLKQDVTGITDTPAPRSGC